MFPLALSKKYESKASYFFLASLSNRLIYLQILVCTSYPFQVRHCKIISPSTSFLFKAGNKKYFIYAFCTGPEIVKQALQRHFNQKAKTKKNFAKYFVLLSCTDRIQIYRTNPFKPSFAINTHSDKCLVP